MSNDQNPAGSGEQVKCDKKRVVDPCLGPTSETSCASCGKLYVRCLKHGGESGARRSLHSHSALTHPRLETR